MACLVDGGRAVLLEERDPELRRQEWRPWKAKGFRVPAPDGVTVWHEREAIRRLVTAAFEGLDADVFLFGSRASGEAGPRSDYDVGFLAQARVSAARLASLEDELEELPIPSHVELVDFGEVPPAFSRMVLGGKDVEIWKRRPQNSLFT